MGDLESLGDIIRRSKLNTKDTSPRRISKQGNEYFSDITYTARMFTLFSFPLKKPKSNMIERHNGPLTVKIAGMSEFGVPYGKYARLIMVSVVNTAIKRFVGISDVKQLTNEDRTIELAPSLFKLFRDLNISHSGNSYDLFTQQATAFANTAISFQLKKDINVKMDGFYMATRNAFLTDGGEFFILERPTEANKRTIRIRPRVVLSELLCQEIIKHPIPLDLEIIRKLQDNPRALDIYIWLTYRLFYLKVRTTVTWTQLAGQFGSDFTRSRDFKREIKKTIQKVTQAWPTLAIKFVKNGITIYPVGPSVRSTWARRYNLPKITKK